MAIQQVGIHNFRLPLRFLNRDGAPLMLETSVTGTVSLEAHKKGINMSRHAHLLRAPGVALQPRLAREHFARLPHFAGQPDAHLTLRFNYPMVNESLRSGLHWLPILPGGAGSAHGSGRRRAQVHPFRFRLTVDARAATNCRSTRSWSAISPLSRTASVGGGVSVEPTSVIEDPRDFCLEALKTETQVMVKREDEQALPVSTLPT